MMFQLTDAGATIVDNFTVKGNSLGTLNWQGAAEWNTGYGVNNKQEQLDCGARFKPDINNYLNTSGSQYKTVQACICVCQSQERLALHLAWI